VFTLSTICKRKIRFHCRHVEQCHTELVEVLRNIDKNEFKNNNTHTKKTSMIRSTILICVATLSIFSKTNAQQKPIYTIAQTFHIASNGGWDYLAVNADRLYVSHSSQVNILDKTTGDSLGVIPNTTGVHGIAFSADKGFTSNGKLNNVTVFDLKTTKVTGQIATGENPDAILYDKFTKKTITCNGKSKDLTIIDASTEKVVATIAVGGKPETLVTDEAGKWFVNIEDKNEIVEIDAIKNIVLHHWSIAPGDGPSGLAIDIKTKRLFAGCDKLLIILDATNGKIVDKVTIGDGCDGVAFDEAAKYILSSNGDGTMTVIKEVSNNEFKVVENSVTKKRARTIAIDQTTNTVYLPTADFEPQAAGEKGRPKMIAGTFQILVLKR
jgi:YVTN family beta-propeller protein